MASQASSQPKKGPNRADRRLASNSGLPLAKLVSLKKPARPRQGASSARVEQRVGISADRVAEIYSIMMHEDAEEPP